MKAHQTKCIIEAIVRKEGYKSILMRLQRGIGGHSLIL